VGADEVLESIRHGPEELRRAVTRPKTISDDELLAVARKLFRERGPTVSTRAIARQAGISEGVLYQRFGSKEDLFFASMAPRAPDILSLLGPEPPTAEMPAFLATVLVRLATYFAEVIPLAIQLMTHPTAQRSGASRAQAGMDQLRRALVSRLAWFESREVVRRSGAERTAQLVLSLAHDWALGDAGPHRRRGRGTRELEEMAEIIWRGIQR
jgi:AcrR family transcriptional regulator